MSGFRWWNSVPDWKSRISARQHGASRSRIRCFMPKSLLVPPSAFPSGSPSRLFRMMPFRWWNIPRGRTCRNSAKPFSRAPMSLISNSISSLAPMEIISWRGGSTSSLTDAVPSLLSQKSHASRRTPPNPCHQSFPGPCLSRLPRSFLPACGIPKRLWIGTTR